MRAALDDNEFYIYRLPISPQGKRDASDLKAKLMDGSATWMDIHPVMTRLWEEDSESDDMTYLIAFLAAAALHDDGTLMDEGQLCTLLSHLKYAARSFTTMEGLKRKAEDAANGVTTSTLKQVPNPYHFC